MASSKEIRILASKLNALTHPAKMAENCGTRLIGKQRIPEFAKQRLVTMAPKTNTYQQSWLF